MKKTTKTAMMNNGSGGKASGLAFRRETIRTLSPDESSRVLGGKMCLPEASCHKESCANTVEFTI